MSKVEQIVNSMHKANLPSDHWTPANCRVLPELEESQYTIQRNNQSVWEHTMSVIDLLTVKNDITLLSGLFHDLGKVGIPPMDDLSLPRFPGHADESSRIAETRLSEWGATPHTVDRVTRVVAMHMFDISNATRQKTIRQFVANVGVDNIDNWFVVRVADSRSYAEQQKYRNTFIEPFRTAVMSYLGKQPNVGQPEFDKQGDNGAMRIQGGDS